MWPVAARVEPSRPTFVYFLSEDAGEDSVAGMLLGVDTRDFFNPADPPVAVPFDDCGVRTQLRSILGQRFTWLKSSSLRRARLTHLPRWIGQASPRGPLLES